MPALGKCGKPAERWPDQGREREMGLPMATEGPLDLCVPGGSSSVAGGEVEHWGLWSKGPRW